MKIKIMNFLEELGFRLKYFSPTLSRSTYIDRVRSYSEEFCHNLIRLILRPTHESSNHWLSEMMPWIVKTLFPNINKKYIDVSHLFNELTDIDKKGELVFSEPYLEVTINQVKNEPYGPYRDLTKDQIKEEVLTLHKKLKGDIKDFSQLKVIMTNWKESLIY